MKTFNLIAKRLEKNRSFDELLLLLFLLNRNYMQCVHGVRIIKSCLSISASFVSSDGIASHWQREGHEFELTVHSFE